VGENIAVAGNPARPYGKYSDVVRTAAENAKAGPVFDKEKIENGTMAFPRDRGRPERGQVANSKSAGLS
jgi:hypothetical protein